MMAKALYENVQPIYEMTKKTLSHKQRDQLNKLGTAALVTTGGIAAHKVGRAIAHDPRVIGRTLHGAGTVAKIAGPVAGVSAIARMVANKHKYNKEHKKK